MSIDRKVEHDVAVAAQAKLIAALRSRVVKVFADGSEAPANDPRTDHQAVWFPDRGVMIHPVSLGVTPDEPLRNYDACAARCRDLRVLGYGDWQLALLEEWEAFVIDRRFESPAVDPTLYPGILPRWHLTSTDCAWSEKDTAGLSASAWLVLASYGYVLSLRRNDDGFALAVRRAGQ
jgi:hypothetical protein